LLLVDEVVQEGEYHDDALEAARTDMLSEQMETVAINSETESAPPEDEQIATWAAIQLSKNAYVSVAINLCAYGASTNLAKTRYPHQVSHRLWMLPQCIRLHLSCDEGISR